MLENTILEIKSVSKKFSGVTVLDDINLSILQGEILGLIGENAVGRQLVFLR